MMGFHTQGEVIDPGNCQKLPGFATFLSFTMPDETMPTVPVGVPSPPLSGSFGSLTKSHHYARMPPASSAGDKFRNWFPDADLEKELRTAWTDPWANKTSASAVTIDPDGANLRMALFGPHRQQMSPPRRTSLPSIFSFTSPEGFITHLDQHPPRRASESNTACGDSNSLLNPLDVTASPDVHGPSIRSAPPGLEMSKCAISNLIQPPSTPSDDAPSTPPPSPVSPRTRGYYGADAESGSGKPPSAYIQMGTRKRKSSDMDNAEDGDESRVESERKRYKCPFEDCGRLYTWKENLTRHITTRHSPIPRRCPFCKVNAARLSFNRIDNFKEHILRHSRDRDNCRARTEFHPAAEEFYRRLWDAAKRERRQAKGRGRGMMSSRSEASDDTVEGPVSIE